MRIIKTSLLYLKKHLFATVIHMLIFILLISTFYSSTIILDSVKRQLSKDMANVGLAVSIANKNQDNINYTGDLCIEKDVENRLLSSEYVTDYNRCANSFVDFVSLTPYYELTQDKYEEYKEDNISKFGGYIDAPIFGYDDLEKSDVFNSFGLKLTEGKYITEDDDSVVISKDLADLNNLKLGDSISVIIAWADDQEQREEISLKISGLYELPGNTKYTTYSIPDTYPQNVIFTSYKVLSSYLSSQIAKPEGSTETIRETVYFDNTDSLKSFIDDTQSWIDLNVYELNTDAEWYVLITKAIQSTGVLVQILMIAISVVSVIVFILINMISNLGRKREMGIILSLGEKKINMFKMLCLENVLPIILALIVGCSLGSAVSTAAADLLTSQESEYAQDELDSYAQQIKESDISSRFNYINSNIIGHYKVNVVLQTSLTIVKSTYSIFITAAVFIILEIIIILIQVAVLFRSDPLKLIYEKR
jgi:putative ABC transport system permease protein